MHAPVTEILGLPVRSDESCEPAERTHLVIPALAPHDAVVVAYRRTPFGSARKGPWQANGPRTWPGRRSPESLRRAPQWIHPCWPTSTWVRGSRRGAGRQHRPAGHGHGGDGPPAGGHGQSLLCLVPAGDGMAAQACGRGWGCVPGRGRGVDVLAAAADDVPLSGIAAARRRANEHFDSGAGWTDPRTGGRCLTSTSPWAPPPNWWRGQRAPLGATRTTGR